MEDPVKGPVKDPAYVAAQTGTVIHTAVSTGRLEDHLAAAKDATATDAMGAVVTFEGTVRDHDNGEGVTQLIYTHHPTADAPRRPSPSTPRSGSGPSTAAASWASVTWPFSWWWRPPTGGPPSRRWPSSRPA